MKRVFLLLGFLFFIAFPSFAGWDTGLVATIDDIYNSDFAPVDPVISSYIKQHPDDPAGYLLRGIANQWRQVSLALNKSLDGKIMKDFRRARDLALAIKDDEPKNIHNLVVLGNAYMYIAKKYLDQKERLRAGNALIRAKNIMNVVIARDPAQADAYFALGIFHYFSDNIPNGLKWLAKLLGFNGNRQSGMEYLRKAARRPNLTQGDAKFMLGYVYKKEKNYLKALTEISSLHKMYPNNPVFHLDEAEAFYINKKYPQAQKGFYEFLSTCNKRPCDNNLQFLAHYYLTEGFLRLEQPKKAQKHFKLAQKYNIHKYKHRDEKMEQWQEQLGGEL